jgi:hypothetical protein
LNGSLSGSARFTSLLTIVDNARFSTRIGQIGRMIVRAGLITVDRRRGPESPDFMFQSTNRQLDN